MDQKSILLSNETKAKNGLKELENLLSNETQDPLGLSTKVLMKILKDNQDTEYGKKYHFDTIHNIKDFQKQVPIIYYENIHEYINRMSEGEKNILTVYKYDHFNETSGTTTGRNKFIPLTSEQTQIFMRYNSLIPYGVMAKYIDKKWMKGRALTTTEGSYRKLESGLTVGAASSKMADVINGQMGNYDNMLEINFVNPIESTQANNKSDRVYIQARFAMMDREMTGIIAAFFNQLVHIMVYISRHYELLIQDIRTGTINNTIQMDPTVYQSLMKKIKPMPERADELAKIFKNGPNFPFATKVWPNLSYIQGVGGASFATYDKILKEHFIGPEVPRIYSGINASEGLWSVPIDINTTSSLLAAGSCFMEFLPIEAGDDFSKIKLINEIEKDHTYELIVTTLNGLYRYRMRDSVTVTGFYNKTPIVKFAGRTNNTIQLDVEKTTEEMLNEIMKQVAKELNFELFDFCVYPNRFQVPPHYAFFVEPCKKNLDITDKKLTECVTKYLYKVNPDCITSIDLKRLDLPVAYFLEPETFILYRDIYIASGRSASQLKTPKIINDQQQLNFFLLFTKHYSQSQRIRDLSIGLTQLKIK